MRVREFNKAFGIAYRCERVKRNITLQEVSEKSKLNLFYISQVERGQRNPSSETISGMCDAIGIMVSTLLRSAADILDGCSPITEHDMRRLFRKTDRILTEVSYE